MVEPTRLFKEKGLHLVSLFVSILSHASSIIEMGLSPPLLGAKKTKEKLPLFSALVQIEFQQTPLLLHEELSSL